MRESDAVSAVRAKVKSIDRREAVMATNVWVEFSARERSILLDALSAIQKFGRVRKTEIDALILKLVHRDSHPEITVGVYGGQVQWTMGNPFPIRICDYDGEKDDLPDNDEQGQACRIWFEPPDAEVRTKE